VRRGGRFPGDQAEVVFSDVLVEQLSKHTEEEQLDILAEIVGLCEDPSGKHPLRRPLAGWNTLDVLQGHGRVVYKASTPGGTGLIEALCLGPRSDQEVYDMADALVASGCLSEEEATQLWDALALLDTIPEQVGLDGWDYRPPVAPEGMRKSAVAAGVLSAEEAQYLSADELAIAMNAAWADEGGPDPERALQAALERARGSADFSQRAILRARQDARCEVLMPRARHGCIRRRGHRGPHRAR